MAIKISNITVIDDSRNIENIGTANLTSLSIGGTSVIDASRNLDATTVSIGGTSVIDANLNIVNANTYNGYTPADEAVNIIAGTGLTGGGDLSANTTLSADLATIAEAEAGTSNTVLMTPATTLVLVRNYSSGGEAFTAF